MTELSPANLCKLGLTHAMSWLADEMQKRYDLAVHIQCDKVPVNMSDDVAIFVFQSVRELLMNVAKHAQVDAATVCIEVRATQLTVVVEDKSAAADDLCRAMHEAWMARSSPPSRHGSA